MVYIIRFWLKRVVQTIQVNEPAGRTRKIVGTNPKGRQKNRGENGQVRGNWGKAPAVPRQEINPSLGWVHLWSSGGCSLDEDITPAPTLSPAPSSLDCDSCS